jgi:hypothetical protein
MKRLLLLVVWMAMAFLNSPYILGTDFNRKELEKEIMNRLVLKHTPYQDRNLYNVEIIKEIKSEKELSDLCNQFIADNYLYLDYFIIDLFTAFLKNQNKSREDPDAFKQEFYKYVIENKEFLFPFVEIFGLFLESKNHGLTGFDGQPKKKVFTLTQLKAIAIRNIFPYKMTKSGNPAVKICVAGEGYKDFPDRNKQLEAFSFESVMNGIEKTELYNRIQALSNDIGKLNFSTDNEAAIKRAQGAIWWSFFQDKEFEKILLDSYNKKKGYLPFVIKIE